MSNDLLRAAAQRRIADNLAEMADLSARLAAPRERGPKLNFTRMLHDLSVGHVHGEDRETLQEYAHRAGATYDPQRPFVPFSALRDLSVGGDGGYLVQAETQAPVDVLRPWSVTARAGIQIEAGLVGDQVIPRTTGQVTPYWLGSETAELTASDPTLGLAALTPKTAGALVAFSRQLSKQANAESFVRRELLRTVGTAVDVAVINGSGASGQPTGILNTSGIGSQSGTSLAYAGVLAMKKLIAEANAPDESIKFLATPAVRELLEARERASGSGFIWDNDRVASRPGYVSTDMPSATMLAGAFEACYVGIWGDGFVVEVNPYTRTAFKSGTIQARILVTLDVAVLHAGAFCAASSIT